MDLPMMLYPKKPSLDEALPLAIVSGEDLNEVVGRFHNALQALTKHQRRVAGLLYLAHVGRLKDSDNRISFSLTPAELAAWYKAGVGEWPDGPVLKGSVDTLKDAGLARFYQRRECRVEGELSNAFRFSRHVFPVTAD